MLEGISQSIHTKIIYDGGAAEGVVGGSCFVDDTGRIVT